MPPCFNLLNTVWFDAVSKQAHAAQNATELQNLVNTVYNDIALLNSTISGQVALLQAAEALLTLNLVNITDVIGWITSFVANYLTPALAPLAKLQSQVTGIETQMTTLTSTINTIASTKFPGVTINFPSLATFCSI
jgi:hypothetical protein